MVDFVAHKFDMLLATTIVESGLDIPNANTIFIDEADRYGLADLHQLRGRVGRYKHRAYCYMLLEAGKHITPNASRRLKAIEEFSEMGAGFAISMRDLEIRGAGNMLGTQQSGHIAAVGYELYCQLLENAVRHLQKKPPKISLEVDIDLPGKAYLPDDYVPDMRLKIDLYRRLSRVEAYQQLDDLRGEMRDRFGPIPAPVERLLSSDGAEDGCGGVAGFGSSSGGEVPHAPLLQSAADRATRQAAPEAVADRRRAERLLAVAGGQHVARGVASFGETGVAGKVTPLLYSARGVRNDQ